MKRLLLILFVLFVGCASNTKWKTISEDSTFSFSTIGVVLAERDGVLKVNRIINQSNRFIVGDECECNIRFGCN